MTLRVERFDLKSSPAPNTTRKTIPDKRAKRNENSIQDDVPIGALTHTHPERVDRARELAVQCAQLADASRGREVAVLDLRTGTSVVDFFVLISVVSRRQAMALASEIDATMKQVGEKKLGIEGLEEGRWILLDYGDFVVHIFAEESRAYYGLDELWGDAEKVDWQEAPAAAAL